ncbi:MAG: hypothetical protein GW839_02160 [Flavobacteriales bacterium]|nr:hypothetical protein [Flavobacteriia bacterium]NCP04854.1 hypothetical protein [Flavobacteriales bacterium]PIV94296.1 MAG: hypothetical protein COW44_05125 [Flavobacteriaceae bacterium CG17_big_fil_post_rev_8_21_14_2_50_33_15]PIY11967.1 MAG: hypothetical protein COZ17_05090 [Flavobacteriaceae bacterium CG_4_10_14_3_um_filter_33_47]PJB16213.1 MAG: hypothetical protein CO117_15580 [Flavobacteriaceae bacterium CG_4_9_14_3_um_filter_33_16]
MKKVIKNSIIMVAMCTALLSNANEGSSFIPKKDSNIAKTTLTLTDVKEGQRLIIKDLNGFILYKEFIKESGLYSKVFDLTDLPDGDYFFEHEKDLEIKTIPFSVKSNTVTFEKDKTITLYKPYVVLKKNTIYMNKLALNDASLDLTIHYVGYNGGKELIYSETIKNTKSIERAYKLMKSNKGNYIVTIHSDNRTYYEYFTL